MKGLQMSYCEVSWSLESASLGVKMIVLKFDGGIGSTFAEISVKSENNQATLKVHLTDEIS